MGKLVLGIIAVTFLQIAFFVYIAIYGPTDKAVLPVRMDRAAIAEPVQRPNAPVATSSSKTAPIEPAAARVTRITRTPSNSKQVNKIPVIPVRRSDPPAPHRDHTDTLVVMAREPFEAIAKNMVAKRYEVIVTDYPRKYPEKRLSSVPREKKRPFLARTLPSLVKKPWRWIKSLGSKLK